MDLLRNIYTHLPCDVGDQHQQVRHAAWRRIRAPLMLIGISLILLMTVVSIAWGQLVGLVVALVFIMVVGIAEVITQWKDTSETVIAEAIGREQVRRRLKTLEAEGWRCRDRIKTDPVEVPAHVVWGPRGVFVVVARSDRGRVMMESGVLTLGGMMPPVNYIQETYNQVTRLRDRLSQALDKRVWVEGVLCMTRAYIDGYQIDVSRPPTRVVHVERLLEFLKNFESRRELTPDDVNAVEQVLREPGAPAQKS